MVLNVEAWAEVADTLHTERNFSAYQTVVKTFAKLWEYTPAAIPLGAPAAIRLLLIVAVLNNDTTLLNATLPHSNDVDDAFLIKLRGKAKQLGQTNQIIKLSLACTNDREVVSGLIEAAKYGEWATVRDEYTLVKADLLTAVFQHIVLGGEESLAKEFEAYHVPHTYEVIAQAIRDAAHRQVSVCTPRVIWFLSGARLATLNNLSKVCNEKDRVALYALIVQRLNPT